MFGHAGSTVVELISGEREGFIAGGLEKRRKENLSRHGWSRHIVLSRCVFLRESEIAPYK